MVLTVTFLQNPVRRPPAVYLSGGKRYRLSLVILHRYPCLDTQRPACSALPGRLNPPFPPHCPLTPMGNCFLLEPAVTRLCGCSRISDGDAFSVPSRWIPSASTRATRSISGGDVLPMTASRPTASAFQSQAYLTHIGYPLEFYSNHDGIITFIASAF